jgi:hypothetical protein
MPTQRRPSKWCSLDTDDGRAQPPADPTCEHVVAYNPTRPQGPATWWIRNEWSTLINPA